MANTRGLRVDRGLLVFDFKPSIGIVAKNVDRFGLDIRSFREPLKRSAQKVLGPSFQKNFDEGGRPQSWEPWSEATVEIRDRMGVVGGNLMVRSGKLRRVAGQLNIWTITPTAATIKNLPDSVWYGRLHQAGFKSSAGWSFPARPFILIQTEDEDAIHKVFSDWLDERLARRGLGRL